MNKSNIQCIKCSKAMPLIKDKFDYTDFRCFNCGMAGRYFWGKNHYWFGNTNTSVDNVV